MKKLAWIALSALLAAGAFALFAGCGEQEVGEEERAEVLAALETIEAPAFEASMDVSAVHKTTTSRVINEKTQWSETDKENASQTMDLTAYERDGLIFGDCFYDFSDGEGERYEIAFFRGEDCFVGEGEWEEVGVKAGNFKALVKACREQDLLRRGENVELAVDHVESYGDFGLAAASKVYKSGSGYRVEYDVIDALQAIFEKLEGGAAYYREHPDCTLGELFAASGAEGLDEVLSYALEALGGTPSVQELFGDPYSFEAAVREAASDPGKFLIENLFGFIVAGSNEGTIDFTVSIRLDKKYAVKSVGSTLAVSLSSRSYWGYAYEDYVLEVYDTQIEVKMEVKPLADEPELTDLSWLSL